VSVSIIVTGPSAQPTDSGAAPRISHLTPCTMPTTHSSPCVRMAACLRCGSNRATARRACGGTSTTRRTAGAKRGNSLPASPVTHHWPATLAVTPSPCGPPPPPMRARKTSAKLSGRASTNATVAGRPRARSTGPVRTTATCHASHSQPTAARSRFGKPTRRTLSGATISNPVSAGVTPACSTTAAPSWLTPPASVPTRAAVSS